MLRHGSIFNRIYRKLFEIFKACRFEVNSLYYYLIDNKAFIDLDDRYEVIKTNDVNELKPIYEEREHYVKKQYENWLKLGYICFIARTEGRTVGLLWLNNTGTVPLEFGRQLILKAKTEAAIIDGYVLKRYRGKGIYKIIWNAVLLEAQKLKVNNLYAQILNNNVISIKVHYPLGMKNVYQRLDYYRIMWFNFFRLKKFIPPIDILELRKDIKL